MKLLEHIKLAGRVSFLIGEERDGRQISSKDVLVLVLMVVQQQRLFHNVMYFGGFSAVR